MMITMIFSWALLGNKIHTPLDRYHDLGNSMAFGRFFWHEETGDALISDADLTALSQSHNWLEWNGRDGHITRISCIYFSMTQHSLIDNVCYLGSKL